MIALASIALLLPALALADALPDAHPLNHPDAWDTTPTFSDEFDGAALDLGKWGTRYPGSDDENYSGATVSLAQFPESREVKDGLLRIRLRTGFPRLQADVTTGTGAGAPFRQKYGWWEIRARMPGQRGFSSAFWLWVQHARIEDGGLVGGGPPRPDIFHADELDIFEFSANSPRVNTHNLHYGARPNSGRHPDHWAEQFIDQYADPDSSLATDFHVYAVEWGPEKLSFYTDDRLIGTSVHPPQIPMHMIIGVRANWDHGLAAEFDDAMLVDYARVYQYRAHRMDRVRPPAPRETPLCPPVLDPIRIPPVPPGGGPVEDGLEDAVFEDVALWDPPAFPSGGYDPATDKLQLRFFALYPERANTQLTGATLSVPGKDHLALGFEEGNPADPGLLWRRLEAGVITNDVVSRGARKTISVVDGKITSLALTVDGARLCLRSVGRVLSPRWR
jgi:beta-glucanase (GH16 family)